MFPHFSALFRHVPVLLCPPPTCSRTPPTLLTHLHTSPRSPVHVLTNSAQLRPKPNPPQLHPKKEPGVLSNFDSIFVLSLDATEALATALANPQHLPSVVEPFRSFSSRGHSNSDPAPDSASCAAPSIHQQSTLRSPPPPIIVHPGRGGPGDPDDDPNDPDYHPGDGPDDEDDPNNLGDPLDDPVLALTQAIHALARSNQHSRDSAP
ncbi:hypothetical protein M404DRAFT_35978 [Pisolithus tinctorius Marx 270]|uniref:Uncharacterized protein n=1 Tax=Pisolithus tinctorius Marx 270 TaxID=870435 RepID=A0A0C3J774_PISTI|nr:hypothetical protein M404DRAFT_35978 [Pisolithus tinctorius Marx 270]